LLFQIFDILLHRENSRQPLKKFKLAGYVFYIKVTYYYGHRY